MKNTTLSIVFALILIASQAWGQTPVSPAPARKKSMPSKSTRVQTRPAPKAKAVQPRTQPTRPGVQRRQPIRPAPARRPTPPPMEPALPPTDATPEESQQSTAPYIPPSETASYWEPAVRLMLSQEYVQATRTTIQSVTNEVLTQSQGTVVSLNYKMPTRSGKWLWVTGFEFGLGTIRFKGTTAAIPDQVANPFYAFVFSPGILFRTSEHTDFGIVFPVGYRLVNWPVGDSTLTIDRKAGAVYGAQFQYLTRVSERSSLHVSFTHQLSFPSTIWGVGYNYAFR